MENCQEPFDKKSCRLKIFFKNFLKRSLAKDFTKKSIAFYENIF